jgi:putative ABC transport system permease protein
VNLLARIRGLARRLCHRRQIEEELNEEIRSHLELLTDEKVGQGMSPRTARRLAQIEVGGVEQVKEQVRRARTGAWLDTLVQDVGFGLRLLGRNPGFTAIVLLTLALGIGANTAIFSVIDTVLLSPLHAREANRIVVFLNTSAAGLSGTFASEADFNLWREQTSSFEDVAGYEDSLMNLTGVDQPEQVQAEKVTANYFRLFGFPLAQGRVFSPEELVPNGRRTAVISYGLWRSEFGSDSHVLGKTMTLEGNAYEIVGIMSPIQTESPEPVDVWIPFPIDPNSGDQVHYGGFTVAGRLKPGVTLDMANAQLPLAADEFRHKYPTSLFGPKDGFRVRPMRDVLVGDVRSSLWILGGAVALLLLIACANIVSLLMVRASGRIREVAIRTSFGAGRGRIVRQMLIESALLAFLGGILGLALGFGGIRALLAVNPGNIPRIGEHGSAVGLSWRVFAFTGLVSLLTGILFGVFPALRSSRADLGAALKPGAATLRFGHATFRSMLVITEVGLSVVLLTGAGLLIRTLMSLRSVDPGIETHNVLTVHMTLSSPPIANAAALTGFVRNGTERLNRLPGVEVSACAGSLPLGPLNYLPFDVMGRPLTGKFHGRAHEVTVSSDYFRAFRIPILRGRAFTDLDENGTPAVAIINEAMARQFWPRADPLQDSIIVAKGISRLLDDAPREIIGIARDVHDDALAVAPYPTVYIPMSQLTDRRAVHSSLFWIIRTRAEPFALSSEIQKELRQASAGLPLGSVHSMDELVGQSISRQRFNMLLLTVFGLLALVLAATGIYALVAYSVAQRTQEIGIRVALGAQRWEILRWVLARGSGLIACGMSVGILGALAVTRVIRGLLFGVHPTDAVTLISATLGLGVTALLACYIPARRAMKVDPIIALRYE